MKTHSDVSTEVAEPNQALRLFKHFMLNSAEPEIFPAHKR